MSTPETLLSAGNGMANRAQNRKAPKTFDGATGAIVPAATPLQRTPLKTLDNVKLELGRVYRAMKSGSIPHEDGTKRAYVLGQLGKVIEMADIERRLDRLERQQAKLITGGMREQASD